jgi:hypothetical protein
MEFPTEAGMAQLDLVAAELQHIGVEAAAIEEPEIEAPSLDRLGELIEVGESRPDHEGRPDSGLCSLLSGRFLMLCHDFSGNNPRPTSRVDSAARRGLPSSRE